MAGLSCLKSQLSVSRGVGVFHSGSGAVILAPSTSPLLGCNHVFVRDVIELCLLHAPDPGEEPLMLCTRSGAAS